MCPSRLVEASRREQMARVERILIIDSYAESLLIQAHLDQEQIPYFIQSYGDPAFGSFWRRQEGWGILFAPAEYRERIQSICSDLSAPEEESDE